MFQLFVTEENFSLFFAFLIKFFVYFCSKAFILNKTKYLAFDFRLQWTILLYYVHFLFK